MKKHCIGNNIQYFMRKKDFSQKELAIRSGCTECAISRYINNSRMPSIEKAIDIAKALDITLDELLLRKETI